MADFGAGIGEVEYSQQLAVGFDAIIDVDNLRSGKKLNHKAAGDDGADAELHAGASVGGHDDSRPVEWVASCIGLNTIERQLTADEENEERDSCVDCLLLKWHPPICFLYIGQNTEERPYQRE